MPISEPPQESEITVVPTPVDPLIAEPAVVSTPLDPLSDAPTVVSTPVAPLVDEPKDTVVIQSTEREPVASRGWWADPLGMGFLIGLLVLVAVGAVIAAILLSRHHKQTAAHTTTVVVTNSTTPVTPAPVAAAVLVPNLVNQRQAAASSALEAQGFTVRTQTVRGPAPAGAVLSESPAPGSSAPSGSIVTLSVSNGAATPAAPPTTTVTTETTTTVQSATTAPATTAPAATAPATTAPATTAPAATTPAPAPATTVSVPDTTSNGAATSSVQTAAQKLSRAGLLASIQYIPGSDPLGTVENQSPAAGATATNGSHVTLNASSGPGQKTQETVPDVAGKTIPQAVAAMQQAGLRLIFVKKAVSQRTQAGTVVEQTPASGKTAPKNAQVLVYMGAFK